MRSTTEREKKNCGIFEILDLPDIKIWTSSLIRTILTAKHIRGPRVETPILDELKSGYLDGLTYNDVMNQYPEEYHARDKDKLNYRYPGGERDDTICRLHDKVLNHHVFPPFAA